MKRRISILIGIFCLVTASASFSQDVARVRDLYVAAAYEEALAAMPEVGETHASTDIEQLRALCLLALGREQEAMAAVERLVRDNPSFVPPSGETTPRMQAMIGEARSRLVPEAAKTAYAEGKSAFEKKQLDGAQAAFQRALALIDSLPEDQRGRLADLRLLASEFLDLSAVRATPVEPEPVKPIDPLPAARPEPYEPPAVVREQLPAWTPPANALSYPEFLGVLRLQIGPDGRVEWARMVKGTHPMYDAALLSAAKGWLYKPATRGGQPVSAQRDIQIRLVPR